MSAKRVQPSPEGPTYAEVAYAAGLFSDVLFAVGVVGESLRGIVVMADEEVGEEKTDFADLRDIATAGCLTNARRFLARAEDRFVYARKNFDAVFGEEHQ